MAGGGIGRPQEGQASTSRQAATSERSEQTSQSGQSGLSGLSGQSGLSGRSGRSRPTPEAGETRPGEESAASALDELICELLRGAHTIAVVGMKDAPDADAHRIPSYLRAHGYVIVPVNPKLEQVDGLKAYPDLDAVSDAGLTIDIVDVFRASDNVEAHVDEVLRMKPKPRAVWLQLGIHHGPSAKRLREAGIDVVQDRCIMVDHRRLAPRLDGDAAAKSR